MEREIKLTKKSSCQGNTGYKVVSVRMKKEMIDRLYALSAQTYRSRNGLINFLLDAAIDIVKVED